MNRMQMLVEFFCAIKASVAMDTIVMGIVVMDTIVRTFTIPRPCKHCNIILVSQLEKNSCSGHSQYLPHANIPISFWFLS